MHDALFAYISARSTTPLTESHIDTIKEVLVPKKLRKRQYFAQEGEICKHIAFVVNGALRQYTTDDKGADHMLRLYLENAWVGDRESWVEQTPSKTFIDAWEDSDLLYLKRADYLNRLVKIPAVVEFVLKYEDEMSIAAQKRVSSMHLPAEQRYAELVRSNPAYIQRFPQHIIASYLGVTKETLSRVRSYAGKKNTDSL